VLHFSPDISRLTNQVLEFRSTQERAQVRTKKKCGEQREQEEKGGKYEGA
jgi:hypothetical protein